MKQLHILLSLTLILLLNSGIFAQSYQGPAQDSISGITQSITSLDKSAPVATVTTFVRNRPEYNEEPSIKDISKLNPPNSHYVKAEGSFNKIANSSSDFLVRSFNGINQTNSIPPDCNFAAGPTHVIATVNTSFSIWDKSGNFLRNIDGNNWVVQSVNNPNVVCDPKIVYDHFNKRFVMVWLTINDATQQSFWTVSVSDDSIPTGTWYTWATPSGYIGGSNTYNFGDYEGLGFDKDCIYITGNQFSYGAVNYFQYSKLRIIPSAQLYANTGGMIHWNDFWDIRVPTSSSQTFGIRPVIHFGTPGEAYLIYGNRSAGNTISVYKISNTLTNPTISGFDVAVQFYVGAPDVDQLGGSAGFKIDGGGGQIRNEPVYRDGYIWLTHAVTSTDGSHSAIHYVKIDIAAQTAVEDVIWGDNIHYYSYPALMVDKDKNVTITYSRSADDEYIGAFYSTRRAADPPGLSGSKPLAIGKGNYVKTFGGTRNRWGDYTGIALDPTDENSAWMLTEFAAATNTWGTWVGNVMAGPKSGVHGFASKTLLDFSNVEINTKSDTLSFNINNIGAEDILIQSITFDQGPFKLSNAFTYPVTINSFDILTIPFTFEPTVTGSFEQNITINSNLTEPIVITLKGKGFVINTASINTLYASTGVGQQGGIHTVNKETGVAALIGPPTLPTIKGIAVNPKTKVVFGFVNAGLFTDIIKVNAALGDAYKYFTLPLADLGSVAFDKEGNFYGATSTGILYSINLLTREYAVICSTENKAPIMSMSFDPLTNELWAVPKLPIGTGKDKVFKIHLPSGDTMNVGRTGTNLSTNAISFDKLGNLYGVTGSASTVNKLISINTTTGISTVVGEMAIKDVTGLTYSDEIAVIVENEDLSPTQFSLSQNYPNPFNPTTVIEYSLPQASNIKLNVYNILGQNVAELVNTFQQTGNYKVNWNAVNNSGVKLTSGIYFYEMRAKAVTGEEFIQNRKMILIK